MTLFLLCIAFFVAGIIDAIAGGGGLITLPSLLLAGIPPHAAIASNKCAVAPGSLVSVTVFARKKLIDLRVALIGVGFGIAGSRCGSALVLGMSTESVYQVVMIIFPLAALLLIFPVRSGEKRAQDLPTRSLLIAVPLLAFIVGLYDGFFGPGTGALYTIAFVSALGVSAISAAANARLLNLVSNLTALYVFAQADVILYSTALPLAACNMLGNFLGTRMAIRRGSRFVKKLLLGVVFLLFCSVAWRFLSST